MNNIWIATLWKKRTDVDLTKAQSGLRMCVDKNLNGVRNRGIKKNDFYNITFNGCGNITFMYCRSSGSLYIWRRNGSSDCNYYSQSERN